MKHSKKKILITKEENEPIGPDSSSSPKRFWLNKYGRGAGQQWPAQKEGLDLQCENYRKVRSSFKSDSKMALICSLRIIFIN